MQCEANALRAAVADTRARYDHWDARALLETNVSGGLNLSTSLYLLLPDRFGNGSRVGRLGDFLTRLNRHDGDRPTRLGIAGGSVSVGSGLGDKQAAWPYVVQRAISQVWPRAQIQLYNGARAATVAAFAALCYDTLFPSRLDLLLVEYSWNTDIETHMAALVSAAIARGTAVLAVDYQHGVFPLGWKQCGFDPTCPTRRLPRSCANETQKRALGAVCASEDHTITNCGAQPGVMAGGGRCFIGKVLPHSSRLKHWRVFAPDAPPFFGYYVPVVSNAAVLKYARDAPPSRAPDGSMSRQSIDYARRLFVADGSHPSAAGHVVIARLVMHALVRAHEHLVAVGCPTQGELLVRSGAFGLVDHAGGRGDSEGGANAHKGIAPAPRSAMCSLGESLRALWVTRRDAGVHDGGGKDGKGDSNSSNGGGGDGDDDGWSWIIERSGGATGLGAPKPGLCATRPNAALTLRVPYVYQHGSQLAAHLPPSVQAYVTYLTSYTGMGAARVSCTGSCACEPLVLDGHQVERRVSLEAASPPIALRFDGSSGDGSRHWRRLCALRVVVLDRTQSGGHKFKITAIAASDSFNMTTTGGSGWLQKTVGDSLRAAVQRDVQPSPDETGVSHRAVQDHRMLAAGGLKE